MAWPLLLCSGRSLSPAVLPLSVGWILVSPWVLAKDASHFVPSPWGVGGGVTWPWKVSYETWLQGTRVYIQPAAGHLASGITGPQPILSGIQDNLTSSIYMGTPVLSWAEAWTLPCLPPPLSPYSQFIGLYWFSFSVFELLCTLSHNHPGASTHRLHQRYVARYTTSRFYRVHHYLSWLSQWPLYTSVWLCIRPDLRCLLEEVQLPPCVLRASPQSDLCFQLLPLVSSAAGRTSTLRLFMLFPLTGLFFCPLFVWMICLHPLGINSGLSSQPHSLLHQSSLPFTTLFSSVVTTLSSGHLFMCCSSSTNFGVKSLLLFTLYLLVPAY